EHEIELGDARREPVLLRTDHLAQARRLQHLAAITERRGASAASLRARRLARARLGRGHLLDERIPLAAGVAAALPLERFGAALRAAIDGLGLYRHGRLRRGGRTTQRISPPAG